MVTNKVETPADTVERIGAYRVVRRLATGGTSDVLLAKAEGPHGFERTVVLKVLLSAFGKDDEVARMFAREASAYARLSHPAIVRLFDFFSVPSPDSKKGGQLVMVLEYVDGAPLARLKSMVKAIGKELDDQAAIYVATCIFAALAAAHSATDESQIPAPVIHRDVNPSNVLIPWDGYPKLADFGVAKVTGLGHHSVVGMIKGTYGYMAPEQVTGNEAVTPRADVYAAAIILWELLTKRRAFQRGALPEVEALRAMAEPRLPALESIRTDVDRTIREGLRRALEPRASARKITAEEMVSILTNVVSLEEGRARLLSILGLVRNDSRAASAMPSVAPPAMPTERRSSPLLPNVVIPGAPRLAPDFAPATLQGVAPPAKAAPPRPTSSAKVPVAGKAPQSLPTRPAMPAVTPPAVGPPPQKTKSDQMPAVTPPEQPQRTKSAAMRLANSVPAEPPKAEEPKPIANLLDGLDAMGRADAMSLPPDSPRTSAKLKDLTGGLGLRDAIDEIMKSSQRGVKAATPVAGTAAPSPAKETDSNRPQMRATRPAPAGMAQTLIGMIPPAPPPMTPSAFPAAPTADTQPPKEAPTSPPTAGIAAGDDGFPTDDGFPNDDDEPRDTTVVLEPPPPMTPRMQPMAQTLAMEARPLPPPPQRVDARTSTGSMPTPRYTPPPMQAVQTPPPPVHTPIAPPVETYASVPAPAMPKKAMGIGTIAVALVGVIALGIAATVAFVRFQAQHVVAVEDAGMFVAPPTPVSAPVTAAPVTSASAPPPVESVVASAPAVSASAAPPVEGIDPGMGRISTSGTAPGRRIFVDDKVVGQTPTSVTVKCGAHKVKLGSTGALQAIDVPCGGELAVGDVFAAPPKASAAN
jgi:serine/threonine-protein kinase